ncbi:WXG100 family type VII secretion target [Cryptosporangium aurantiacum]|uniref:ESAT-6-like protein n=1 Tax=Cryptosporangium aurantiacum TaxID=134849 RepID=A0A1M7NHW7_9ACTN|nr:WXG100 family type VII secretion target [Cryptosporangium aurantiacum]SHN03300.1 WXG100 family type VII secretion target [Cryptosporangium aurantiacum]
MPYGSDEIAVNFASLTKAAEDIQGAIGKMTSELDALERGVQPLIATWDGEAKAAYLVRKRGWDSASADLTQLLTGIKAAVMKSAEIMAAREKQNASMFNG